jgi:endogenous inhibitor of DNA gyrase (YacG/DUF329 family)
VIRKCPRCGKQFAVATQPTAGRPRRWCSPACRRLASEERRAAEREQQPITYIKEATSLDGHVRAVLDSPSAYKRILRELADRDVRRDLDDAKWSSVADELARLRRNWPAATRAPIGTAPDDSPPTMHQVCGTSLLPCKSEDRRAHGGAMVSCWVPSA